MKRKNGEEKEDVGGKRRTNVFVMKVMEKKKLKNNGDVLRSKLRSRRSKHGTLRASRDHEQDVIVSENVYYEQE